MSPIRAHAAFRWALGAGLGSLLAIGLGFALWRSAFQGADRAPITLAAAPGDAWPGTTATQRHGVLILFKDHLEVLGNLTVVEETNLQAPSAENRVVMEARPTPEGLALRLRGPLLPGGRLDFPPLTPPEAFARAGEALGLRRRAEPGRLLPVSPEAFWELAGLTGVRMEEDPAPALARAEALAAQESGCASAWATAAALAYWQLTREGGRATVDDFARVEGLFRRAFALVPHHPRAVDDFVGFKTDQGNPRQALDTLFKALERYPRVAHLHGALAYPARVSGLLEGASRALAARDRLAGSHRFERDLVENTSLYRGEAARFEAALGQGQAGAIEPSRDFYRGYVRLLQGRAAEAHPYFLRAQAAAGSWPAFERLAQVYQLGLEGQRAKALGVLRKLKAERARLRVPDGEFTFKLAEAFGFLGEPHEALETGVRAFAQGFGCTPWYERTPFLAGVRHLPRWHNLRQHLQERQALMERLYPAERFGTDTPRARASSAPHP